MSADPRRQWRDLLALGADAIDELGGRVHGVHRAISDLALNAAGLLPNPLVPVVRPLHDGITDGVYQVVRQSSRLLLEAAGRGLQALPARQVPDPQVLWPAPLAAAVSGFVGDHLATRRRSLAPAMALIHQGQPLTLKREALAQAFPAPRRRLVLFVHGLACSESAWTWDSAQGPGYGERLYSHGWQPLYLRYNSGLHIAHNGLRLARLLRRLCAAWPVPVEELLIIGHSMGGLVARVALAREPQLPVRQLICLGSPHRGAPLERLVHRLCGALEQTALGRPWSGLLDRRAAGIKDLRHGTVAERDWRGRDLAHLPAPASPVAEPQGVRYRHLGAQLGGHPAHPLGRLFGDGLVPLSSSLPPRQPPDAAAFCGLHHLQLLNHPQVWAQLAHWLDLPPALATEPLPAPA
ncbi:MAG TPA: hypothetical protein VFV27_08460 [Nevskiaceae bacterium]|nr:hypothetical protein [Nevskiaceae bacterium]